MSTPVIRMRLPSSRPMALRLPRRPRLRAAGRYRRAPQSLRCRRCGSGSLVAPVRPAARWPPVWRRSGFETVDRLAVEVPGAGGASTASRRSGRAASSTIDAGDNEGAADADLVVIATPWDGATQTAQQVERHLRGKVVISMANALTRIGNEFQPLVPPRGSVAASVQAARARQPGGGRVPPRAGQGARRPRPPDRERRADLLRPPRGHRGHRRHRGQDPEHAAARLPASCRTPRRSRRSPRCCSSSTCATRPGSR